jgi:hypothetical protein
MVNPRLQKALLEVVENQIRGNITPQITLIFTRNPFLERKALPTTFLPSVKTLTKNSSIVFLLAQVFCEANFP